MARNSQIVESPKSQIAKSSYRRIARALILLSTFSIPAAASSDLFASIFGANDLTVIAFCTFFLPLSLFFCPLQLLLLCCCCFCHFVHFAFWFWRQLLASIDNFCCSYSPYLSLILSFSLSLSFTVYLRYLIETLQNKNEANESQHKAEHDSQLRLP